MLLVVGASGCGKSTFIQEFLRGSLAPEIRSALPKDAPQWTQAFGRRRRWLPDRFGPEEKPRGQILHQEITEPHRTRELTEGPQKPARLYHANESPLLMKRVGAAEKVYVVIVRPSQETLIRQLTERTAVLHFPVIARARAARFAPQIGRLERALPAWMTDNAAKILGRSWAHRARIRGVNDRLCDLYAELGAVDVLYSHWETSFLALWGQKLAMPIVYVEPASKSAGTKTFRLTEPTKRRGIAAARHLKARQGFWFASHALRSEKSVAPEAAVAEPSAAMRRV